MPYESAWVIGRYAPTMTTISADTLPDALGAPAREFISKQHRLLIGSERPEAADGRTFATLDPATGRPIAEVAHAGVEDVQRAVTAAREAFSSGPWASMPASGRERLMLALAAVNRDPRAFRDPVRARLEQDEVLPERQPRVPHHVDDRYGCDS